jgi:hypothetical protein
MAKRNQPATDVPAADVPADASADTAATSRSREIPTADLDMSDFERRADRSEWITPRQAAEALGFDADRGMQRIRNAVKTRAEFTRGDNPAAPQLDNVVYVGVAGYEIPPYCYINRAALDRYAANIASDSANNGRAGRNGAKRWIIRVRPDQLDAVRATLIDGYGITLEVASTPKRKAGDDDQPAADGVAEHSDQPAEIAAD